MSISSTDYLERLMERSHKEKYLSKRRKAEASVQQPNKKESEQKNARNT